MGSRGPKIKILTPCPWLKLCQPSLGHCLGIISHSLSGLPVPSGLLSSSLLLRAFLQDSGLGWGVSFLLGQPCPWALRGTLDLSLPITGLTAASSPLRTAQPTQTHEGGVWVFLSLLCSHLSQCHVQVLRETHPPTTVPQHCLAVCWGHTHQSLALSAGHRWNCRSPTQQVQRRISSQLNARGAGLSTGFPPGLSLTQDPDF